MGTGLLGDIGTIEWCRRTNGILGRGEKARYFVAVMLRFSGALPRLVAYRAGVGAGGTDVECGFGVSLRLSPTAAVDRAYAGA